MFPALRCVLQHWYELRLPGEALGDVNRKRFSDIRGLSVAERRRGVDALRGMVLSAVRGEAVPVPSILPVAAGRFPDEIEVETYIRRSLRSEVREFRLAATYAAVFLLGRSEEVGCILSERVVLAEEDRLLVLAARDALTIRSETSSGGRCSRCKLTGSSPSTPKPQDWMPVRAS